MAVKLVAEIAHQIAGTSSQERQGRWRLNAGSEMIVSVNGLNKDKPIRLVVDLATCKPKNEKVVALSDHDSSQVIGYWDKFTVCAEGVEADLHVMIPQGVHETVVLADAVRVGAMARAGVPVQVSIGAEAGPLGRWVPVKAGETVTFNGQQYSGDGDMPLYILCDGQIYESSIVTFGADSETGRVAAAKTNLPVTTETSMSDQLKALLGKYADKHHGLIARCVAESNDEPTINQKVHAAEIDDKDKELKAAKDELASCKAKLAEYEEDEKKVKGSDEADKDSKAKLQLAAKGSKQAVSFSDTEKKGDDTTAPETMTQAMKVIASKDPTMTGFKLRKAARAAYPNAKEL